MLLDTLALFRFQLIADVLIRDLVDNRIEFLTKRRIGQQPQLNPLFVRLVEVAEQIVSYLSFLVVNVDRRTPRLPLLTMASDITFVPVIFVHALKYAFFKAYTQMVRARSQCALGDRKLPGHLPVMFDLLVSFVQVIIENELLFVSWQQPQTPRQAFRRIALPGFRRHLVRHDVDRDFLASQTFANYVTTDAVKVSSRIADVRVSNFGQTPGYSLDGLVGIVFRITQPVGNKHPDQARADHFVTSTRVVAIRIQPLKQCIK